MKALTLMIFLASLSLQCYSQVEKEKFFYAQKVEKFRKMKNTGKLLTAAGSVLLVTGILTLTNSSTYNSTNSNNQVQTGLLAYIFGIAGLGSGIPIWIVGGHQQNKYEEKLMTISGRFNMNTQQAGLTLTYRF